jgi:hypothetical protein
MDNLASEMLEAANVMHWFGKYRVANVLILAARLLKAKGILTVEKFASWVEEEEVALLNQNRNER